jgi:hypothetical protein
MSELDGPRRSKSAIDQFESWLKERCRKGPVDVKTIEREFQYSSGHEPRKIRQYLYAIESAGKIRLQFNGGAQYCELVGDTANEETAKKVERRFNVETMSYKLMPEEEDENATEYMQRRKEEKEERLKNELRARLKEKMASRKEDSVPNESRGTAPRNSSGADFDL